MVTRPTRAEVALNKEQKARAFADNVNNDGATASQLGAASGKQKLVKTTIRLHPDLLNAIERKATAERRTPADVLRDFIVKGMHKDGIYL